MYEGLKKRLHKRIALNIAGSPLWIDLQESADAIEALQKLTDAQLDIIKQYQEQFSKTRWIPVTDHTPKYSGYYLVCDTDEHVYTAWFGNTTKHWWTEGVVTHWMMRPEPPKKETSKGDAEDDV